MATSVNSYDKSLNSYNLHYEQIGKEVRCIEDELPFEIPDSWEWVRLNEIRCKEIKRGKSPTYITNSNIFVFAQKCNSKYNGIDLSLCKCLDPTKFRNYDRSEVMLPGDIIINSTGTGTLGRIGYLSESDNINNLTLIPDSHVTVVRLSNELNSYFMKVTVDLYHKYFEEHGEGSTNQKELKPLTIQTILVPIPPRNEQNRIVNKLKELNPLIEKYKLAEEKLYELNSNIKNQLKKSILQYAIEGKLVPQDPNDEPASVLLDRIRKEKQNLIAEGKIKKDKNESIIYRRDNSYYEKFNGIERCIEEEIPYIIPDSWEWIRLGSALINRDSERIPLSVSERAKLEKKYDYYGASGVIDKVDKYLFDKPLLLVGEDGANLLLRSKPIAFIANGKYWVNNHAHVLDSCSDLLLEYVEIYINSQNLSPYVTGTAQPKMNQEKMNSILIPIPPYNEQNRIITESKKIYSILK